MAQHNPTISFNLNEYPGDLWTEVSTALVKGGGLGPIIKNLAACSETLLTLERAIESQLKLTSLSRQSRSKLQGLFEDVMEVVGSLSSCPHRGNLVRLVNAIRSKLVPNLHVLRNILLEFPAIAQKLEDHCKAILIRTKQSVTCARLEHVSNVLTPQMERFMEEFGKLPDPDELSANECADKSVLESMEAELDGLRNGPLLSRFDQVNFELHQLSSVIAIILLPFAKLGHEFRAGRATLRLTDDREQPHFDLVADWLPELYKEADNSENWNLILDRIQESDATVNSQYRSVRQVTSALVWLFHVVREGRINGASFSGISFQGTADQLTGAASAEHVVGELQESYADPVALKEDGIDTKLFEALVKDWAMRKDELAELKQSIMYQQNVSSVEQLQQSIDKWKADQENWKQKQQEASEFESNRQLEYCKVAAISSQLFSEELNLNVEVVLI